MQDFIERNKYGIVGTLGIHLVILMLFNYATISKIVMSEDNMIAINFADIDELMEQVKAFEAAEMVPAEEDNVETNRAVDEAAAKKIDYAKFEEMAAKEIADQVKSIEDEMAEKLSKENQEISIPEQPMQKVVEESVKKEDVPYVGPTNISFYLEGRKLIVKANPIYLCERGGAVVVEIVVDVTGKVLKAKVDQTGLSSNQSCLCNAAKIAALESRFDQASSVNIGNQKGTITYVFK